MPQPRYPIRDKDGYGGFAVALVDELKRLTGIGFDSVRNMLGTHDNGGKWTRTIKTPEGEWQRVLAGDMPSEMFHRSLVRCWESPEIANAVTRSRGREIGRISCKALYSCIERLDREYLKLEEKRAREIASDVELSEPALSPLPVGPASNASAVNLSERQTAAEASKSAGDIKALPAIGMQSEGTGIADKPLVSQSLSIRSRIKAAQHAKDKGCSIVAQAELAEFFERRGKWKPAIRELKRLAKAQNGLADPIYQFQARARLAFALVRAHTDREALMLLSQLNGQKRWTLSRRLDKKTAARVAEWLAHVFINQGKPAIAARVLRDAMKLRIELRNPVGIGSVWYYRTRMAIKQEQWGKAKQYLTACRRFWSGLRIRELSARAYFVEAKLCLARINSVLDVDQEAHSRGRIILLKAGILAVRKGLARTGTRDIKSALSNERAEAMQIRARLNLLLIGRTGRGRAMAQRDYQSSLKECLDPVLSGRGHKALARFALEIKNVGLAKLHAKKARTYLNFSGKIRLDEQKEMSAILRLPSSG